MNKKKSRRGRGKARVKVSLPRGKGRPRKAAPLDLHASVEGPTVPMTLGDFYKPRKKPVTVRLDVDVIEWFKKDGKKYQSRINAALRRVMEQEMRRG